MILREEEYERFLDECHRLYEELENTMDAINLLVAEINLATEDIRESFEIIDCRMNRCTARVRHLTYTEPLMHTGFQGAATVPDPEAGET